MIQEIPARRLRVYLNESDRWQGHLAYEWIVREALAAGMAGATVLRGPMGFGGHHAVHTAKVLRLAEDLPTVVEIIDQTDRISAFAARLLAQAADSLITVDDVTILRRSPAADAD